MLDALLNSVLPIFAIVGIGLFCGWRGLFDRDHAQIINRFLFYVGIPVLLFGLLARVRPAGIDWAVLISYQLIEIGLYLAFFAFYRLVLKRPLAECAVLAMATVFSNHFYYVLPIAIAEYGAEIGAKITLFVVADTIILYFGNMMLLEVLTGRGSGNGMTKVAGKMVRNPQTIAIGLGILAALFALPLDNGLGVFLNFVGGSAAPLGLFALGVILTTEKFSGNRLLPLLMCGFSLVVMPGIGFAITVFGLGMELGRAAPLVVTFAGPVGLMPFVLALQYGQPTGEVARAVLLSTLLSVITVSIALQIV